MASIACVPDPKSVGPRIRMMKPHLTPLEAKVVDLGDGQAGFHSPNRSEVKSPTKRASPEAMVIMITKSLVFRDTATSGRT